MKDLYSIKLSITLTDKEASVLRSALKSYIFTISSEVKKNTAKELLELVDNAEKSAKKSSKVSR